MRPLVAALLLGAAAGAWAQATPVGLWRTVDDQTGQAKSLVRITEAGGTLSGTVEKLLDPARQDARCTACEGADKDKPILGLTILRGLRPSGDDTVTWTGGEILDPNNGKVYKLRVKMLDGGSTLEVRGYLGVPLLGRSQTWTRVAD